MTSVYLLVFSAFVFSLLATWFATNAVRKYVLRKNVLDIPNERSSHSTPTPRGGGLAIVTVFAVMVALAFLTGQVRYDWAIVLATGLCISFLGWRDDVKGLSAALRLGVQVGAAAIATLLIRSLHVNIVHEELDLGFFILSNEVLIYLFLILFAVWMTNLYNFMDGIDGILGIQALTVSVAAIVLAVSKLSGPETASVYAIIAGACAGFLILNWSPAKIFMGDVGSAFLGFVLAFAVALGASRGDVSWTAAIVLHAAFVGDATWTLFARLSRGQKPHQAHRSHIYQKMVRKGAPHARVSLLYGAYNLFWLLPVAFIFEAGHITAWVAYLLGYLPVFAMAIRHEAGIERA